MPSAGFTRLTGWTGVATGVLGGIAVGGPYLAPGLSGVILVTSMLTTVWVMLAGWELWRMGRCAIIN